jgi:two-component system CheB/CheR fusion protein
LVGQTRDQFAPLDSRWKIYQRLEGNTTLPPISASFRSGGINASLNAHAPILRPAQRAQPGLSDLAQRVQRTLLAEHTPPAVVVDEHGEVLYVHGRTARFLEFPTGELARKIFDLVPDSLRYRLQATVRQAHAERREIVLRGVHLGTSGQRLDLSVQPLEAAHPAPLLVVFRERPEIKRGAGRAGAVPAEAAGQIAALELEVSRGRETLRATLEEMTLSVEELRTSNEELQSTNEELQSTNEELTTSKEELQSLNEELHTVNAEHLTVIQDQAEANDDIRNLLENIGTATVFLGNDLHIRRFTSPISHIIPLTTADQDRPLSDLNLRLRYTHLLRDLHHVLDTLEPFETQVQTHEGEWYMMRVNPYRTHDNLVEGVVVAFTSIALIKSMEWQLVESLQHAESMIDGFQDPLVLLDQHVRAVSASRALLLALGTGNLELGNGRMQDSQNASPAGYDLLELQRRLRAVIASEEPLSSTLLELNVSQQQTRRLKAGQELDLEGQPEHAPLGAGHTPIGNRSSLEGQLEPARADQPVPVVPPDSNK